MGRLRWGRGFSLIETVIALGIFAMIGVAFLTAITTSTRATGRLDDGVQAEALARSHLEAIKECSFTATSTYDACLSGTGIVVPDQFVVSIDIDCSGDGGFDWNETCGSGSSFERIVVRVSHGDRPVLSLTTYKRE